MLPVGLLEGLVRHNLQLLSDGSPPRAALRIAELVPKPPQAPLRPSRECNATCDRDMQSHRR